MMIRRIAFTLLMVCSLPLLAQTATRTLDQTALQSLVDKVSAALNAHDEEAFSYCFSEDAEFTNPVGTLIKGRSAIQAFHARLFSTSRSPHMPSFSHAQFKVLETRVKMVRPDVASVDLRWEQYGALAPDGSPWGPRLGILSWIAIRDHDTWLIEVWHNIELPQTP